MISKLWIFENHHYRKIGNPENRILYSAEKYFDALKSCIKLIAAIPAGMVKMWCRIWDLQLRRFSWLGTSIIIENGNEWKICPQDFDALSSARSTRLGGALYDFSSKDSMVFYFFIMDLENFTTKCWENVKNGDMLLERIVFFRGDLALITQG